MPSSSENGSPDRKQSESGKSESERSEEPRSEDAGQQDSSDSEAVEETVRRIREKGLDPEENFLMVAEVCDVFCRVLSIGGSTWRKRYRPQLEFTEIGRKKVMPESQVLQAVEEAQRERLEKLGLSHLLENDEVENDEAESDEEGQGSSSSQE